MHPLAVLSAALTSLPTAAKSGYAYRAVDYKYMLAHAPVHPTRVLYGLGAPRSGARFTPVGGPAAIYLAAEQSTALAETTRVTGAPSAPIVCTTVSYQIERVIDLTDPAVQAALGTTRAEILSPWRLGAKRAALPPTQILGQAVYDSGRFQAIWYESVQVPGAECMAVFIDRLVAPAFLEVFDPNGNIKERLP